MVEAKHLDSRYGPYADLNTAKLQVPLGVRMLNLTVGIINGSVVDEYWWKEGITDDDLILKNNPIVGSNGLSNIDSYTIGIGGELTTDTDIKLNQGYKLRIGKLDTDYGGYIDFNSADNTNTKLRIGHKWGITQSDAYIEFSNGYITTNHTIPNDDNSSKIATTIWVNQRISSLTPGLQEVSNVNNVTTNPIISKSNFETVISGHFSFRNTNLGYTNGEVRITVDATDSDNNTVYNAELQRKNGIIALKSDIPTIPDDVYIVTGIASPDLNDGVTPLLTGQNSFIIPSFIGWKVRLIRMGASQYQGDPGTGNQYFTFNASNGQYSLSTIAGENEEFICQAYKKQ